MRVPAPPAPNHSRTLSSSLRTGLIALTAGSTAGLALVMVPSVAQAASGPTTVQMSVTTGGFAPGHGGNGDDSGTERRLLSDDGRYAVFASSGPVVPGQQQLDWQIVRRDRQLGTTLLISKSSAGVKGNGGSTAPSVSADGQVIAFHSYASNLVPGDTNGDSDIFVHDVRTGRTTRASVTSQGTQVPTGQVAGENIVGAPSISADGRWVGFTARTAGFVPGDELGSNAYLHDRQTGSIDVVSRTANGLITDAMTASTVSPSADGSYVAFHSGSANVVPSDGNGDPDVFVWQRSTGKTITKVPAGEDGAVHHSMTPDGRFIVFESSTGDLTPAERNGKKHIFVFDRTLGTTDRVSVAPNGDLGNQESRYPAISKDGRYVSFRSTATNLVPGDTNNEDDIFRRDRSTGKTIRISVTANGSQNTRQSRSPAISGDGQHVLFESHGSTLTPVDTRTWSQVFVRDLVGKYPALHARLGALPARVQPKTAHQIATYDIRTGPALAITWTPSGSTKGGVVRASATVSGNRFVLRSPKKPGTYAVTVHYADNLVGSRTIKVIKPRAKRLPKQIARGKKLKVVTVGVARDQRVEVRFKPRGAKGKTVNRKARINKSGVVKVKTPPRRGTYRVIIRSQGTVLLKATLRIR